MITPLFKLMDLHNKTTDAVISHSFYGFADFGLWLHHGFPHPFIASSLLLQTDTHEVYCVVFARYNCRQHCYCYADCHFCEVGLRSLLDMQVLLTSVV